MKLPGAAALVTGGASGLGLATATSLAAGGASVVILDLPASAGAEVASQSGGRIHFAPGDVTDPQSVSAALQTAVQQAPVRVLVHCAGRGATVRLVDRDGAPGSLETFESIVRLNLLGTFNVLRLTAAQMARQEPSDGERGVCVLTASVAAWEGQVGQIPYASAKAGVVGMTLVAARDLASKLIRVCSIAPGVFDTPILDRLPAAVKNKLAAAIPHPARLGRPEEFAALARHIVSNPMLNGETIRLDGAVRMPAR
jgi:NAD(P)-dependent dehydrogenase (short-subunit alcohol dehydrogenase family)